MAYERQTPQPSHQPDHKQQRQPGAAEPTPGPVMPASLRVGAATLLRLQGQVGNHAVQRFLAPPVIQRQIGNGADQRAVIREHDNKNFTARYLPDWSEDGVHRYELVAMGDQETIRIVSGDDPGYRLVNERVAFGHGVNLGKDYQNKAGFATCVIVFYGPLQATLARAVAKWIRVMGPLPSGAIRVVSNGIYERLLSKYKGSCPSFEQELWEKATQSDYPKILRPGDALPNLSLERQTEEDIRGEPQLRNREITQVQHATPLHALQAGLGPTDVLHWGACQNPDGKNIEANDSFVILRPDLSAHVYPPDGAELRREHDYQQRVEQAQQRHETVVPQQFQSQANAPVELSVELQQTLRANFKSTDGFDDQIERLQALAKDHNVPWNKLARYLAQNGLKAPRDDGQ